uniref:Uncharacterized protein n=1 Tax=Anopheles culicifacies TaxID=139723 RepID=A0A182MVQ5_9DIPT
MLAGKPVKIPSNQQELMKEKFKENQFNLLASDMIWLNRSLTDVRHHDLSLNGKRSQKPTRVERILQTWLKTYPLFTPPLTLDGSMYPTSASVPKTICSRKIDTGMRGIARQFDTREDNREVGMYRSRNVPETGIR